MFNKVINSLGQLKTFEINNIDATQFNDEVANRVNWEALITITTNFNTRKLVTINSG